MDAVELRPNKIKFLQPFALLILGILLFNYFTFFDKRYRGIVLLEIADIVFSIFILYFIYKFSWLLMRINRPRITLTKTTIEFYENGSLTVCNWSDIMSWEINAENDSKFLFLQTRHGTKKIGISDLNKSPSQISSIIQTLK